MQANSTREAELAAELESLRQQVAQAQQNSSQVVDSLHAEVETARQQLSTSVAALANSTHEAESLQGEVESLRQKLSTARAQAAPRTVRAGRARARVAPASTHVCVHAPTVPLDGAGCLRLGSSRRRAGLRHIQP